MCEELAVFDQIEIFQEFKSKKELDLEAGIDVDDREHYHRKRAVVSYLEKGKIQFKNMNEQNTSFKLSNSHDLHWIQCLNSKH